MSAPRRAGCCRRAVVRRFVDRLVLSSAELRRQDHRQITHGFTPTLIASAKTRLLVVGGAVVRVLGHGRISGITVDQSLTGFG
jgi:hypothetical protein